MSLVRAPLVGKAAVARSARARDRCQFAKSSNEWEGFTRLPRAQRFGRYNERRP
jgi:hypothetical protein